MQPAGHQQESHSSGVWRYVSVAAVLLAATLVVVVMFPATRGTQKGLGGQQRTVETVTLSTDSQDKQQQQQQQQQQQGNKKDTLCHGRYKRPSKKLLNATGRSVLVTGVAGFIASHVAKACVDLAFRVVGVDDMSGGFVENIPKGVKFLRGDVKDPYFVEKIFLENGPFDFVYHLAAYAAEGMSHFIRSYNYRNNLVGSVEMLNFAIKTNVSCFVFTSSIAAYGAAKPPIREETPMHPEDPYGISKYAFEMDLQAAHELFGLNYIIFRPHNVYGPHQNIADKYRNVIGIFMNQILNGKPMTIFGDGTQTRAFSYIDDVAPIIAKAPLVPEAYNERFNIGAEEPSTLNALATLTARAMKKPDHSVVHLEKRFEVQNAEATHVKLHCFFAPKPPVSLAEGLNTTAAWVVARTKGFRPIEFQSVEVKRKMPPSWMKADLVEQSRIFHSAVNNTNVDQPKNVTEAAVGRGPTPGGGT